jgi:hypothetical protein
MANEELPSAWENLLNQTTWYARPVPPERKNRMDAVQKRSAVRPAEGALDVS